MAVIGSCTEQATGPTPLRSARVLLQPQFSRTAGQPAIALPISRIRLTARNAATDAVLATETETVDPLADSWEIEFDVPVAAATNVVVTVELIHVTAAGVEIVEWSGITAQFLLTPGLTADPTLTVAPGPLDNLKVTAIQITDVPPTLLEGQGSRLRAVVTAPTGTTPRVFWSTSNASVLQVASDGEITALIPGTARITAAAGLQSAFVDITVRGRPSSLAITPPSAALDHIGAEVTFAAQVLDSRGNILTAGPVTWSTPNPDVLQHLGDGRFRALRAANATVQAALVSDPTVTGSAAVTVTQRVARIIVTPPTTTLSSRGATVQLAAATEDAGGASVPAPALTWTTSDALVATVTQTGLVTAVGDGVATITAAAGAVQGSAQVRVASQPTSFTIVAGTNQTGEAGSVLPDIPAVLVRGLNNEPLPGITVSFTITNGGGSIERATAVTNASGIAEAGRWTLGTGTGLNTLEASVPGLETLVFRATAHAGPAAIFVLVSGNGQTAPAGTQLPAALVVRVTDRFGNPNQGVVVSFATATGSASPANPTTNAAGEASTQWTLGSAEGTQELRATVAGLPDVVFNAVATVETRTPAAIVIHAGNGQTATVNTAVTTPPAVRVTDGSGNPLAGVNVLFAVAAGGGQITGASATTDANGVAVVGSWTLGATPGANQLSATVEGLTPVTFTATAQAGAPALLTIHAGNNQTAPVGTAVTTAPAVRVTDASGNPLAGVNVVFAVVSGGGQITGGSAATDANGVATVGSWTLGATPGANQLSATVEGLTPVTFDATAQAGTPAALAIHAGNNQSAPVGTAVTTAPAVRVTDGSGNPLAGVNVVFAVTLGGGQITGASPSTDANGVATVGSWTLGPTAGSNQLTATVTGLDPVTFAATGTSSTPTISIALADGQTNVGVSFHAPLRIVLSVPAPAGGLEVGITSDNTAKLQVANPGTVVIPQGATEGTIQLLGVEAGSATLTAVATGYTQAQLVVTVSLRLISLPVTLNVPYGQNASLPIQLAEPAPAGGVVIAVVSSDETRVRVLTPSVTIPAGSMLGSATVEGTLPGSANVTANATGFIGGTSNVTTTANLDIVETSVNINASFGGHFTVRLRSAGNAIAAPAGGLQVSLAAVAPLCVVVPATATIPQGLTEVTVPVSYGDASLPCSSTVQATAQNIQPDNVTVNVALTPVLSFSISDVGAGLQRLSTIYVNTTSHTGLSVQITSADPSRLILAPDPSTVGSSSLIVTIPAGQTSANFYAQANGATGTAGLTATATGVVTANATVTIVQPGLDIVAIPTTMTTLSADAPFYVRVGIPNGINSGLNELQAVRAGASPLVITVESQTPAVATLTTTAGTAAVRTVQIAAGLTNSPTNVAAGGVAVHPVAAGSTLIRASATGVITTTQGERTVTISAPSITVSAFNVGAGLRRSNNFVTLGVSTHGGVTVRVTSSDPSKVLLSTNTTNTPTAFIDVALLNGDQSFGFLIHGLEGTSGNVTITATAPAFSDGSTTLTVVPPAMDLIGVNTNTTTTTPDNPIYARLGIASGPSGLSEIQEVRTGGTGFSITFTTSNNAVATLATTAGTAASVTIPITSGYFTPTTVGSGGVAVRPLTAGSTTIAVTAPGVTATTAASRLVTVAGSAITLSTSPVGSGLQRQQFGQLSGTDHGGVTVRITSANAGHLLIAPNAVTVGTEFIDVVVPDGQSNFSYFVQAIDGLTGGIVVTATATGLTSGTTTIDVVQPGLDLVGVNTSVNTLSPDDAFNVRVGLPYGSDVGLYELQNRRWGAPALVATVTSSTTAAQIVSSTSAGGSGTTTIVQNTAQSPSSVANGGLAVRPFSAGTTVVSATIPGFRPQTSSQITVTVNAPSINLNATTVGAGLMKGLSGTLSATAHGGVTVRLTSSNPSIALLSPNATTAGTAYIDVVVPDNVGSFNYYVHGVEGAAATVAIVATAGGFTDGNTTATIVQPGFDISGVNPNVSTITAPDVFTVRVGLPNSNNTALNELQPVRAGAPALAVTVTTSNAAIARLATSTASGASVNLTIPAGSSGTQNSFASGGVQLEPLSPGDVTVSASIPGYINTGSRNVTVAPAMLTVNTATVGAGLQTFTSFSLNGGNHGGITVRLTSSDPTKLLVAPSTNTAGSAFIDVVIAAGVTSHSYVVQGLENVTGSPSVTATATGITTGSATILVVQPAFDISGLSASTTAAAANDPFTVRVGLPNSLNTALQELQTVRAGSPGLTVSVTSSNGTVGRLMTEAVTGTTVTVMVAANTNSSPFSVAAGGVAFDPLAAGSTTIAGAIAGFRVLPTSSINVTVN